MFHKYLFALVLSFGCLTSLAQFRATERALIKSMRKQKWTRVKQQLVKAYEKDSANAAVYYLHSRFFFSAGNPAFNTDSANYYNKRARQVLQSANAKEKVRMDKAVDSVSFLRYQHQIDSAGFARAKMINTEGAFLHFLAFYPSSAFNQDAIALRDEAAYLDALNTNSYQAFLQFLEKYPTAVNAPEAKIRYERLLYADKTKDRSLSSYRSFLSQYPATPFRREVEKNIFEIATASGEPDSLVAFLKTHPHSYMVKLAEGILFHILREHDDEVHPYQDILSDSLQEVMSANRGFVFPVLDKERFAFMNKDGRMLIKPTFQSIPDDYTCGNITTDVLMADHALVSRTGVSIMSDSIDSFEDVGLGLLKIVKGDCKALWHKAGFLIDKCIDDVKTLAGKFVAVRKNQKWAVFTLAGKPLTLFEWHDVFSHGNLIVFKDSLNYRVTTAAKLGVSADGGNLELSDRFDGVKPITPEWLCAKAGDFQGVLDQSLNAVIPFEKQALKSTFFGITGQLAVGYNLYGKTGSLMLTCNDIKANDPWIAVKQSKWQLLGADHHSLLPDIYDSISFSGPFALGFRADSLTLYFTPERNVVFTKVSRVAFIPGKDSSSFIMVQADKRKTIFDKDGQKLFTTDFDQVEYAGQDHFIVTKKDRKGLVDRTGKIILQPEYDAIGSVGAGSVTMLKNKKFGAYHLRSKKLIKPQYEKNPVVYDDTRMVAFQRGFFGFIDWNNKPQSKFEFDEIQKWNDTTALVKRNWNWAIYDVNEKEYVESSIKQIAYISDSPTEKLGIVKQDDYYGVISNKRGFVIPASFTYLLNVGSGEQPLFFTEKHVEEASIFVVIYYSENGSFLYRQVYEEADYEKILCSDN